MAGIYIHIPFCRTRCGYCDFHTSTGLSLMQPMVMAVCKEMELRKEYLQGESISTIYFGGGTPSMLNQYQLRAIFDALFRHFNILSEAEITLEANPDDLSEEKLKIISDLPVNRLSMGVQSLNDNELKIMNRRHNAAGALEAVSEALKYGFSNLSIDLIYGVPEQTAASWINTLDKALKLPVSHISSYSLMYEEGTPFYKRVKNNTLIPMDEELNLELFQVLITKTKANGFRQYEISNFAKPGMESRHNSSYWKGIPYLGLGPSAHSYNGTSRQWNIADNTKYIKAINENGAFYETENLNDTTLYNEFIITRIRTMDGFNMNELTEKFGMKTKSYFVKNAQKFVDAKWLEIDDNNVRLTQKGIFISDNIMSGLLIV